MSLRESASSSEPTSPHRPAASLFDGDLEPQDPQLDRGIQSSVGIRWLLLLGALIVSASLIRLVAEDWTAWPPAWKALSLICGSLGIFALGDFTYARLRLPTAGTGLLALFATTLPVFAWGAHDRGLIDQPSGLLVFLLGATAFLFASRRVMRQLFAYEGKTYPLILTALLLAVPLLSKLTQDFYGEGIFIACILLAGLALKAGSQHINRFFFHRDRRQGVERPLHALPFALLAVLFGGVAAALMNGFSDLALPLILFAVAMVDTGEEYYRALTQSTGRIEQRWPGRSRWLLASGFCTLALGIFLAWASESSLIIAVGSTLSALRLGSWALRYQKPVAYSFAILCTWQAALTLLLVGSNLLEHIVDDFVAWLIVAPLAVLVVLAATACRYSKIDERLKSVHAGVFTFLAILLTVAYSLFGTPLKVTIGILILLALTLAILRRNLPILGLWVAAVLPFARVDMTATSRGLVEAWHLGLLALSAVFLGFWLRRRFSWLSQRLIAFPAIVIGLVLALAAPFLWSSAQAATLLLLCTAVFFSAAAWFGKRFELTAFSAWGATLLGSLHLGNGDFSPWFAILAQALLITFWIGTRLLAQDDPRRPTLLLGAWIGALTNISFLTFAWATNQLTIEPLVLLFVGAWSVQYHLQPSTQTAHRDLGMKIGIGLLLLFAPIQLISVVDLQIEIALLLIGATLYAGRGQRSSEMDTRGRESIESALQFFVGCWLMVSTLVCLIVSGPAALMLALAITVTLVRKFPQPTDITLAASLLPALQLSMLGTDARWIYEALQTPTQVLPFFAFSAWIWQMAVRRWASKEQLRDFGLGLDSLTVILCIFPFFASLTLSDLAYSLLFATALGRLAIHFYEGWKHHATPSNWLWQGWAAAAVWMGSMAGWWKASDLFLSYSILILAVGQIFLAEMFERHGRNAMRRPTLPIAAGFALFGGLHALANSLSHNQMSPWLTLFPAFLASLFFFWMAIWNHSRIASATVSASLFALALNLLLIQLGNIPIELQLFGPGLALMALSWLLRREMGRRASQWVFSFGALCLYAIPVFGSLEGLTWGWQVMLLLLALGFGALSFYVRSPSLLVISTGAASLDLAFFVLKLRQDAPLMIWILGILLGLALMAMAAFLEHRREQILQRLRLWGHELQAWA